ncbi:hypothetical protein [Sutcliffiella horikoshii]|uniref:hypothetical protein n=1 Tax=Sutcliffiella horikoshii TaxID=79883 RepID=UPI003CF8B6AF
MRYFRLEATHNENDTRIGIEEIREEEVVYIASIYRDKQLSKYEALRVGIDRIADLLGGDEAKVIINDVRASTPDRLVRVRENIHVKRRKNSGFIVLELSADAVKRKNSITENLKECI